MKSRYKAVLFDVDGVLIIPPKLFSVRYCEKYGVNAELQEQFYATKEFKDASVGKFDLKDAIRIHNDKWQWHGDVDELLRMWFTAENQTNEPLLKVVEQLRSNGSKAYLATQQEKYRAQFLRDEVFKNKIDGMFVSCDIGYNKHENHFWKAILNQLQPLKPSEIAYFDDRQSLSDLAKEHGIAAFLYNDALEVQNKLFVS
jgi:putative hydrolase of the HAD superfamily